MTAKVDFKRSLDCYRAPKAKFQIVEVPSLDYLMIDGHGDPNLVAAYRQAIEALFPLAYALKFASKRELGRDYVVMPLEGLWWAENMGSFTTERDKSRWEWTLMIMVPNWIDSAIFEDAVCTVQTKGAPDRLGEVRLGSLAEGLCVQRLHLGSYDDEAEVLAEMHDRFIPGHDLQMVGKHHEIYLSDARRVEPAKMRTILRQPVRPAPIDLG